MFCVFYCIIITLPSYDIPQGLDCHVSCHVVCKKLFHTLRWSDPQSPVKVVLKFMNGLCRIDLFTFLNTKRVNRVINRAMKNA